jgi:ATP-binding cassette subfamily F protein uup
VLVLDEPTNDLDIDTLELLEELLEEYTGTVFLVSHDRTFLDNVVTQVIVSEGEGQWREYIGGYSDWERYSNSVAKSAVKADSKPTANVANTAATANVPAAAKAKKLSYKEQRELEELPKLIAQLEAEQATITAQLADADLYKNGPDEANKLNARFAEIDEELLTALDKWETIEARSKG